jgi:SGNH domain (fused to AT3 domains)
MKRLNLKSEILGGAGCPILAGTALKENRRQECVKVRDQTLDHVGQTSLPMIYVQKWDFYNDAAVDYDFDVENDAHSEKHSYTKLEQALERTMEQIVAHGRRVLIIGSQVYPNCPINPPRLFPGPLPHAPPRPCPPSGVKRRNNRVPKSIRCSFASRLDGLARLNCCGRLISYVMPSVLTSKTVSGSTLTTATSQSPVRATS